MKLNHIIIAITILCFFCNDAKAEIFDWHSTNIQLLRGWDYESGREERTLITFEHANGWKYGDFYTFTDFEDRDDDSYNYYAEFSPRFSFGKILNKDLSSGIIKDYLISTTYEKGRNGVNRYLIGGAVDFNLPGFKYFKTNLYHRHDPDKLDSTWQVTLGWKRPFTIEATKFVIEGFADFFGEEGGATKPNQLIVPRFLVDVGSVISHIPEGKFFTGMEWQYWHNKFGTDGVTESVPQLQFKVVF